MMFDSEVFCCRLTPEQVGVLHLVKSVFDFVNRET